MLIVDPNLTFEPTATIHLNALKATFGVRCKLLPASRLDKLYKQWTGQLAEYGPGEDGAAVLLKPAVPPSMTDRQFIDEFLVGFGDDVQGADKLLLPFTPDNLTQLLDVAGAKKAVIDAFLDGYSEAEAKNSPPLPAG